MHPVAGFTWKGREGDCVGQTMDTRSVRSCEMDFNGCMLLYKRTSTCCPLDDGSPVLVHGDYLPFPADNPTL